MLAAIECVKGRNEVIFIYRRVTHDIADVAGAYSRSRAQLPNPLSQSRCSGPRVAAASGRDLEPLVAGESGEG